jgi:hypothetical protein
VFLDGWKDGKHVGWQEWQDVPQYRQTLFGISLRQFMLDHEISVREVGTRMRVPLSDVSRIRRGELIVSPEWARLFAETFGLNPDEWEAKTRAHTTPAAGIPGLDEQETE